MKPLLRLALFAILGPVAGCRGPGREVEPRPGDFAFVEVQLRG